MQAYAELFGRSRRPLLAFVVLVSALALVGLLRLEFDDQPRAIFASDDERFERLLALRDAFGSDDNDALFVFEGADWFLPARFERLAGAVERLQAIEGIQRVGWMGDVPVFDGLAPPRSLAALARAPGAEPAQLERLALAHPLVGGRTLSADGRTCLVLAVLDEDVLDVKDIARVVGELRAAADAFSAWEGVRVRVTGIPPIRVDIFGAIKGAQVRYFLIGAVLCLGVSLWLFRSPGAVLATSLPPLVGAAWAMGFVGLLGERVNLLTLVLQMLVVVIALTDAIHLMIDVRLSRARGVAHVESVVRAIRHLGTPCALTSLTTAVGFGSLAVAGVPIIRGFGLLAAAGVVLAFLAVLTTLPLLAVALPSVGAREYTRPGPGARSPARAILGVVLGWPRAVIAVGVLLTAALSAQTLGLEPENRLTEALPRGESYEALMACEAAFGGVLPNVVVAQWDERHALASPVVLGALAEVEELLEGLPEVGPPLSVRTLLAVAPGGEAAAAALLPLVPADVLERLARPERRTAIVVAGFPDGGSDVLLPVFEAIERGLARIADRTPGLELHLTGTDYVARSNVNGMIADLLRSLGLALLVIFGVIALEFRSLAWGAISLLPNLFPLAVVGGGLALAGVPLQMSSALLFTVLLGLAVDDTIHFLARFRRELARAGGVLRQAVEDTFRSVGRAILVTTLVLGVGFGVVGFSEIPVYRLFAVTACLGLAAALVGDLVLLPALLLLWERRRLSRPGRG